MENVSRRVRQGRARQLQRDLALYPRHMYQPDCNGNGNGNGTVNIFITMYMLSMLKASHDSSSFLLLFPSALVDHRRVFRADPKQNHAPNDQQ